MRSILILLLLPLMLGCSALEKATFNEKELLESCRMGRNHDLIKNYLYKDRRKLTEIKDTVSGLNLIELATFAYLDPCRKSYCIKSDIDILKLLEIFGEVRLSNQEEIYATAIKNLIKYNSYAYVPYSFEFLLYSIGGMDNLNKILDEDTVCKKKWDKGWKSCFEK